MNEFLTVLQYATPVGLAAIGEIVGQRSGVMQIGLEGIMLTSAFTAAAVTVSSGNPTIGILAGIWCGIILSLLSALFCVLWAIDQVVVGTAFNLLALGLTGSLYRLQFAQAGGMPSFERVAYGGKLDWVMLTCILLAPAVYWVLQKTSWGLLIRGVGENPQAVEALGYKAQRLRLQTSVISGALAGLAGAYLSVGIVGTFAENMTVGKGFLAIALVTFGRWNPIGVLLAALFIGYAEGLQFTLQAKGVGIPYPLLLALPYVLSLAVLTMAGKGAAGPAALGLPYKGKH